MYQKTIDKLESLQILEQYNNGASVKSLYRKYDVPERTLSRYLFEVCGVKKRPNYIPPYDINVIKEEYENGKTLQEIADEVGCCRQSLAVQLRKIGVRVIRKDAMYDLREDAFDDINTEEQAYWLGFMFADGNLAIRDHYIRVNLSGKDTEHLIKFKKFLNYKRDIHVYTIKGGYSVARMSVSNKHMWLRLNELGCTPHKSNTLKFPADLFKDREDLIRHFIRGYWDGDGCLSYRDKEHKRPGVNVIGTNDFLREMEKHMPVNPMKTLRQKHKNNNAIFIWNKEDKVAFVVAEYLYKDANVYLDRKYAKYLEYCNKMNKK